MQKVVILGLFILMFSCLFSESIQVKRDNTQFSEGPGSWYSLIATINRDIWLRKVSYQEDEDEDLGQWIKVIYQSREGFISGISTKELPPKRDIFASMAEKTTSTSANRHGVSAGVKGFGERFSKTFKGDSNFLVQAMNYNINPIEYKKFKKATYKGFSLRNNRKKVKLPTTKREEYFSDAERGLGLGIATVIAELGLLQDKNLQDYVNYVGLQLVEAFDLTDIEFKFFILNIPNPNAYATPGGIIFITKGMLNLCSNEAELAVILAHEITHVAYNHGVKESAERRNHILAEDRFNELDSEVDAYDDETLALEKELENDAFTIYETLNEGRLDQYEKEADQVGMIIAARAGYDAKVLLNILDKIGNYSTKSNNQHYRPDIITLRKGWAKEFIRKTSFPDNLFLKAERFKSTVRE